MATYTDQLVVYSNGKIKKTASGDTIQVSGNIHIEDGAYDLDIKSHDGTNGLKLAGTVVTATAAELNILDGVTASAAELNILDGVTASTAELNYLDISTLGTSEASKVVTADSSGNVTLAGNLTVTGTTTTVSSTNTIVADQLLELGNGRTGAASGDAGIIIERGDDANAIIAWDESADIFVLGTTTATGASSGDLTITAAGLSVSALTLNSVPITSTAAELNILDGVTATAAELNLLDGVTATTAELNILDGVTSTATELNLVDGSVAGTIVNNKAVVYGAAGEVNATTLQIAGTSITSTAAELNILDGVTATTTELNIMDGDTTASSITVVDADRLVLNDDGVMKQVAASTLKTYFQTSVTASAIAADDITAGDAEVTITTTSGAINITSTDATNGEIIIDSPVGVGTKVTELQGSTVSISSGNIVSFDPNSQSNLFVIADKSSTLYSEVFGVALETITGDANADVTVKIASVWGTKVTVKKPALDTGIYLGTAMYLGTGGAATSSVPTSGVVYRVGYTVAQSDDTADTVEIAWMPQFIADLG